MRLGQVKGVPQSPPPHRLWDVTRRSVVVLAITAMAVLRFESADAAAMAAMSTVTGTVVDGADVLQPNVTVEALGAGTATIVASSVTGQDGSFSVALPGGIYDFRFTPPVASGLRASLATGIDSRANAALRIVLKPVAVVRARGTMLTSQGTPWTVSQNGLGAAVVYFWTPNGPIGAQGTPKPDGSFQVDLLAGRYRVGAHGSIRFNDNEFLFNSLYLTNPIEFDRSQLVDLTLPTKLLTVSVRDANGAPVTGASVAMGARVTTTAYEAQSSGQIHVNSNGDLTVPLPTGATVYNATINLDSGLIVPFTVPPMDTDRSVTVTIPTSIHLSGALRDTHGNVYGNGTVDFQSASVRTASRQTDENGRYDVDLDAGPYRVYASGGIPFAGNEYLRGSFQPKDPIQFSESRTYDITIPTKLLTVSVRDARGELIPTAAVRLRSSVSTPTYTAHASTESIHVDANGNLTLPIPTGADVLESTVILDSGLAFPFPVPRMDSDRSVSVTIWDGSVHVEGTFSTSQGTAYRDGYVHFRSMNNIETTRSIDGSGQYDTDLWGGYGISIQAYGTLRFDREEDVQAGYSLKTTVDFPLERQTFNLTVPTKNLTVSVRDFNGAPITSASLHWSGASVSTSTYDAYHAAPYPIHVDANGNRTIPLPAGSIVTWPVLVLDSGPVIPLTIPVMDSDRHLVILLDPGTGQIIVDDTPPTVSGTPDRPANTNGWYNAPVSIQWSSHDPAPSSGAPTIPPPTTVTSEGANQTIASDESCDPADNCAIGSRTVSIDTTAPTITYGVAPAPNGNGWHDGDVTVTFTCYDELSGIATCPTPVTVSTEGAQQSVTGTATDRADNTTSVTVNVSLDHSAPTINAELSPAANSHGWHNGNVTVSFACADTVSDLASCTTPVTLTGDGSNQVVTGTAVDNAGNTTTTTATVHLDATAPTISAAVSQEPGSYGWNNGPVTVTFTCADALSGVETCTAPVALTIDGANKTVIGTAIDMAGNTATATVVVSIDQQAPLIVATRTAANGNGWNNSPVTVTYTCSDALSLIAVCPDPAVLNGEGGQQAISGTAADRAGNTGTVTLTDINIDLTPPVITAATLGAPNPAGWHRTPPTIRYTCTDGLSGVALCPADVVVAGEGANQVVTRTAVDNADNTAETTVSGLNTDYTSPAVAVTGPEAGHTYLQGRVPPSGCTTTDILSGVAVHAVATVVDHGNGSYTSTCAGGTDVAGNTTAPVSVTYAVVAGMRPITTNTRNTALNTSISATVGASGVNAGETVTVSVAASSSTGAVACADSKGNTYTVALNRNASSGRLFVCTATVSAALTAGDTVTATYPLAAGVSLISVNVISALATTGVIGSTISANGNSVSPSSGTATTNNPNALLFGVIAHNNTATLTPGPGYATIGQVSAGSGANRRTLTPEYRLITPSGAYSATASLTSAQQWRAVLIIYQAP